MIDGHPFATDELDRLRSIQRAILRRIQDWLVRRVSDMPEDPDDFGADQQYAEHVVRTTVETEFLNGAEKQLEALAGHSDSEILRKAVGALAGSFDGGLSGRSYDLQRERNLSEVDPETGRFVRDVVPALVLADLLADDGYRDPRTDRRPSDVDEQFVAGLLGALVGGIASFVGSVVVNRLEVKRSARIRLHDELLPELEAAVDRWGVGAAIGDSRSN